nr:retrovirus-related Pol polyprotein from transposon TNT 1-94 [Tanacetum cinerariifolium]
MDHQYPTVAKIPVLDTGKFEQWQFRIQQYLQHEHYALWEVIEFRDSYVVPANTTTIDTTSGEKLGRTVTLTAEDMQRKKNDVKARTTLLLSLPDEHQLQFKMDIKWNMALLSMRADKFWKKIGKKISIQGSDVAGFDKSKVECFNCHKMGHFARECRAPRSQDRGRRDNYRQGSKAKEQAPKALMKLKTLKQEKEGVDGKLAGLLTTSKDLDNHIESQRSDKNKEGLGYTIVPPPPPPAQLYLSSKKDLSWTGLPECADDTVTDYSRPSPTLESTLKDDQNRNPSVSENVASPITPKHFIKFVKPKDSQSESKTDKKETPKKPPVKYAEQYKKPNKKPNVRGNQRNWNNLKSHQFGPDFVMKKKACYNCECIVLGKDFKLLDDANILLRTPKQHNMYSIDLNNIVPHKDLTCLVAKASADEWIKRELSNARTPQQNGVAERRNRTLIEAVRIMLVDAKLPDTFWAEAVNTACYVQNRVLVNKSYNKTPYELFNGRSPAIRFLKPFSYHVMILNTLDNLEKFEEKWDEGTKDVARQEVKKDVSSLRYIALPNWAHDALLEFSSIKPQDHCSIKVPEDSGNPNPTASTSNPSADQIETLIVETLIPTVSLPVPTAYSTDSQKPSSDARLISKRVANQEETLSLDNILSLINRFEDILRGTTNSDESNGEKADISNMETAITASPTPTLRIHKDHPKSQIIGPMDTLIQPRNKSKETLVDCPKGVRPIGTKWFLKNKKDERGIVIRNKARLVAQGHTQEERIDYDEVFAHVARIKAIRLFLAYNSFMGFIVYQMDVMSAFLYGTINEEVYVMPPLGFQDLEFPAKVYKVEKAIYGLHQAARAWYGTLSKYVLKNGFRRGKIDYTLFIRRQREDFILVQVYVDDIIFGSSNTQLCREFKALMHEKFQMSAMGKLNFFLGLQVLQKKDGIFLSQDKYVGDILKKVRYSDVRHQVTPKECHLHAVKRIFRYLKGHLKLGLWYPKESPFDLVAYSDSDYGDLLIKPFDARRFQYLVKGEHNVDFQPMVDFIEASPLRVKAQPHQLSPIAHPPLRLHHHHILLILHHHFHLLLLPPFQLLPTETTPIRQYTRRARIAQSSALPTVADEPVSPQRAISKGEACHTDSSFIADQDRATIAKSSTLPHDLAPRVTSPAAIEGSMQQTIPELTDLCTSLQRQLSELTNKFQAQEVEINRLKERVKLLEQREGLAAKSSRDDAPIKGRSMDEGEAATERISDDSKEMATVLTSMDAATVLASGVIDVPTGSGPFPLLVLLPKVQFLLAVKRELEEQLEREDQRRAEQIAIDVEVARIHVEEDLQSIINGLDSNNETIAKYLQKYHQFSSELLIERRVELIRWKVKDFRGMTFEEVEAKFNLVWKQMEDFIPMGSKEEAEKIKRKGLNLEQASAKKQKTSEEVPKEAMSPKEVTKEK